MSPTNLTGRCAPIVLANLSDVCSYLGAWTETNESLSRRVYKDTDCGAWAKVEERIKSKRIQETWSITYEKVGGRWLVIRACRPGFAGFGFAAQDPEFLWIPVDVRDYFFIGSEHDEMRNSSLDSLADGKDDYSTTETVDVQHCIGTEFVFLVGSIVEGTDAEVSDEVILPTTSDRIDAAIAGIESAVDEVWFDTHGCEQCATRSGEAWRPGCTPIDSECPACRGRGIPV